MAKRKGMLLSASGVLALFAVGLALTLFLPLPEDRAFSELSKIQIASFHVLGATPREAVAELNAQIQKTSSTRYRFSVAAGIGNDTTATVSLDLKDLPATECAGYVGELSSLKMYGTAEGVVLDIFHTSTQYRKPSWRRTLRHWLKYELPDYPRRALTPGSKDPFSSP